jgi:hypothetical protein
MSDHYDKIRKDAAFRRAVAERVGVGFGLPKPSIVPSVGDVPSSSEHGELATTRTKRFKWRARRDSNSRPSGSKPDALSS